MNRRALPWLGALPIVLVGSQVGTRRRVLVGLPPSGTSAPRPCTTRATAICPMHRCCSPSPPAPSCSPSPSPRSTPREACAPVRCRSGSLPCCRWWPLRSGRLERRLISVGAFPWWTAFDPTFWRGLVLQIPIGIVASLVARLLQRSAVAVGRSLSAGPPRHAASGRRLTAGRQALETCFALLRLQPQPPVVRHRSQLSVSDVNHFDKEQFTMRSRAQRAHASRSPSRPPARPR